ncbi:MAG: alpha/beta fold hydrolase [Planctomycetota bacterium]
MNAAQHPRLVFLPGLGADHRLFRPQLAAFKNTICPRWIQPKRGDSLAGYARRFAAAMLPEVHGAAGDGRSHAPYVLCGFSFGGMVALEIARHLPAASRPAGVILIAGVRSKRGVSNAFRVQQTIGSRVPSAIAHTMIAGPLTSLFAKRDGLNPEYTRLLKEMASDIDTAFLFWAARACASWQHDGVVPVPVAHVHGRRDPVIPYVPHPGLQGGEATLLDAGHLISWTATSDVNAFIAEHAQAFSAGAASLDAGSEPEPSMGPTGA